jgi:hypothetical protein
MMGIGIEVVGSGNATIIFAIIIAAILALINIHSISIAIFYYFSLSLIAFSNLS